MDKFELYCPELDIVIPTNTTSKRLLQEIAKDLIYITDRDWYHRKIKQ